MYINLKLTHLHLLGILLFIIISANFGFAVYEGVENLVDQSKDRTVGTLSSQKQKDTVIQHYANSNEKSDDFLTCKKHLMNYMLENPSCRKVIAEEASSHEKPKINSERVAGESIEEQIRRLKPKPEDLYILKSKIVPPVCPKCPEYSNPCSVCNKKQGQKRAEEESIANELSKGGMGNKGPINSPAALAASRQVEKRQPYPGHDYSQGYKGSGAGAGVGGSQKAQAPIPRLNSFADFA
tara:strand:+ start:1391 stop:2107 length:717 start_codon:yes stop_codon:yes gene_type:complete